MHSSQKIGDKRKLSRVHGEDVKEQAAELSPSLKENEESWYLPTFGVYHPWIPNQIRVVFDSNARYHSISLNSVLLTGTDMNNSLLGVLLRCRKEPIAVTANIKQMFYCFLVWENHRKYPRFLWHRDNDMSKEITEYQMHVYVFGNSPFLASAIYGLRCAAQEGEQEHGSDNLLRDIFTWMMVWFLFQMKWTPSVYSNVPRKLSHSQI